MSDVRRARNADQERLGRLWLELLEQQAALDDRLVVAGDALERWRNDYRVWLSDETHRLFVVEQEEAGPAPALAGFAAAHRRGVPPIYEAAAEVYLSELYVHPDVRRQGLGTRLAQAVRDWAEELSADRIRLGVLAANEAAQLFWAQQQATPFTHTLTIEMDGGGHEKREAPPRRSIGF